MTEKQKTWGAVGLMFIIGLGVMALGAYRDSLFEYPKNHYPKYGRHQSSADEGVPRSTDKWMMWFTGVLAVSTVALWWSTRGLVIGAEKTAERQLRAYVLVDRAVMEGSSEAHVIFRNSGQTPAYDVSYREGIAYREYPLLHGPLPEPKDSGSGAIPLAPGRELTAIILANRSTYDEGIAQGRPEDTRHLYIYGDIAYRDAFGEGRTTKFRLVYRTLDRHTGTELVASAEGNEAT